MTTTLTEDSRSKALEAAREINSLLGIEFNAWSCAPMNNKYVARLTDVTVKIAIIINILLDKNYDLQNTFKAVAVAMKDVPGNNFVKYITHDIIRRPVPEYASTYMDTALIQPKEVVERLLNQHLIEMLSALSSGIS